MMYEDYRLSFYRDCAIGTGAMFAAAFVLEWFGQSRMSVLLSIIGFGLALEMAYASFAVVVWQERRQRDG